MIPVWPFSSPVISLSRVLFPDPLLPTKPVQPEEKVAVMSCKTAAGESGYSNETRERFRN
jgi:hypothetical protein